MKKLRDYISHEPKQFSAVWYEDGESYQQDFTFDMVIDEDAPEWLYALADIADEINALEVGRAMPFQGNRDDKGSAGYIARIK